MKILTRQHEVEVRAASGLVRALGYVFVLSGALVAFLLLGGASNLDELSRGAWWLIAAIALGHLCGGLVTVRSSPVLRITLDADRREVRIRTRRLLRAGERVLPLAGPPRVGIREETDSDGDAHFRLTLALAAGPTIDLMSSTTASREWCEARRAELIAALETAGIRPPAGRSSRRVRG